MCMLTRLQSDAGGSDMLPESEVIFPVVLDVFGHFRFTHAVVARLKLQSFGLLMRRADSLEKTLMLRKIEGRRGRG